MGCATLNAITNSFVAGNGSFGCRRECSVKGGCSLTARTAKSCCLDDGKDYVDKEIVGVDK
jgi:hypothetical protein